MVFALRGAVPPLVCHSVCVDVHAGVCACAEACLCACTIMRHHSFRSSKQQRYRSLEIEFIQSKNPLPFYTNRCWAFSFFLSFFYLFIFFLLFSSFTVSAMHTVY